MINLRNRSRQPPVFVGPNRTSSLYHGLVSLFDWRLVNLMEPQTVTLAPNSAAAFSVRPTELGDGWSNGGTGWQTVSGSLLYDLLAPTNTAFSVTFSIALNATGLSNTYIAVLKDASAQQFAIIYGYVANTFEIFSPNSTGGDFRPPSDIVVADTLAHTINYSYDGATLSGALDGVQVFSTSLTANTGLLTQSSAFLYAAGASSAVTNATILAWAVHNRGLSPGEQIAVTANPWQLFAPIKENPTRNAVAAAAFNAAWNVAANTVIYPGARAA